MRILFAFLKKEWMDLIRSGRLLILLILFTLFGLMNPAIAKLTPWMMEMMADSLEGTGLMITEVQVDAMTSWTQFFKNIPLGLIVLIVMQSSIFTKEYQTGTLILPLTKGLTRAKVVIAKTVVLAVLWSACYWLCFGITYGYNAYYWDNRIACNLFSAAMCWWLLGLWACGLLVLFSALLTANTGVLVGTGGVFLLAYLVSLFPRLKEYTPAMLMNTASLLSGAEGMKGYGKAIVITGILCVLCVVASIPAMNKKRL